MFIVIVNYILEKLIDTNMNEREMTGKSHGDSKLACTARSRVRPVLETVAEMSNEISAQCTERLVQSRGSANLRQSSPFVVEKIEFDLEDPAEESKTEILSKQGFVLPPAFMKIKIPKKKEQRYSIIEKSLVDSEIETKFPAHSYRTPMKIDKKESFLSPKDPSSGKNGFFSMRKKTVGRHEALELSTGTQMSVQGQGTGSSKIKIVNNIFQNTFLQSTSKADTSTASKRKIKDIKFEDKSKGALRKKGNCSLDIKDSTKTNKRISTLLSPQRDPIQRGGYQLGIQKPSTGGGTKTGRSGTGQRSILEDSAVSGKNIDYDRQLLSMQKFHAKLSDLINEVQGSEGEVDLKTAWRFVKDVVVGYSAASRKIKQLEAILQGK